MLGNAVEIILIFRWILGPLVLGWAPNHFVWGAQLAPGKKGLVFIPDIPPQMKILKIVIQMIFLSRNTESHINILKQPPYLDIAQMPKSISKTQDNSTFTWTINNNDLRAWSQ